MEEFLDGSHFFNQTSVFSEATQGSNDSSMLSEQFSVENLEMSGGNLPLVSQHDLSTIETSGRKRYSRMQDQHHRETLVNLSLAEGSGLSASQSSLRGANPKPENPGQNRIDMLSKLSHEVRIRAERRQVIHSQQPCIDFPNNSAPKSFEHESHAMAVVFNKSSHRTSTAISTKERDILRTRSTQSLGARGASVDANRWAERRSSLPLQSDLYDITVIALGRNLRKHDQMSLHHVLTKAGCHEFPHLVENEGNVTVFTNSDQVVNARNDVDPPVQAITTAANSTEAVTPRVSPLTEKDEVFYSDLAIDRITVLDSFRSFLHQVGMNTDFAAETGK
jgi:hypothetical protein